MPSAFVAGFFVAWTPIFLVAAVLCAWARKRRRGAPSLGILCVLFATLTVASAAAGARSILGPGATWALALSETASLIAPAALLHYVLEVDRRRYRDRVVIAAYAGVGLLAVLQIADILSGSLPPSHAPLHELAPIASPIGQASAWAAALLVVVSTVIAGQAFARSKRASPLHFLAACALSVTVLFDAISSVALPSALALTSVGYAAFTLAVVAGQIVEFTERRDRLIAKTDELSKRSETLTRSFRELRAAQSELVRKEQLAAIGELSAVVAHEVRNPLAVITNAVATLRRPSTDADARATLLGILSEETTRLNQLVGDLLHYARPFEVEPQSVSIRELIDKATASLAQRLNLELRILEEAPVGKVGGDPLLLRQAIDNVVNNATQAMPSGGVLTITLYEETDGVEGVHVIVRDDGEGMDTVVRKRALDPFFTTRPTGTGLGLAIVARVVDAHAGRLTIKSKRDTGTEVGIFLPRRPELVPPSTSRARLLPPVIEPLTEVRKKVREQT